MVIGDECLTPAHISTLAKDQTKLKIPVDSTARALMSSSRGEGCGREARGVRGARGVRAHPTPITQLVQVVHLIKHFNLLLLVEKIALTASDICESGPSSKGYWPDTIPGLKPG